MNFFSPTQKIHHKLFDEILCRVFRNDYYFRDQKFWQKHRQPQHLLKKLYRVKILQWQFFEFAHVIEKLPRILGLKSGLLAHVFKDIGACSRFSAQNREYAPVFL